MPRKPGPKPKPIQLRVLEGNPGKRPLSEPVVQPRLEPRKRVPAPPIDLGKLGKAQWRRVAKRLVAQGVLTDLDLNVLEFYCREFERYKNAEEQLKLSGDVLRTGRDRLVPNPYLAIARQALNWLHKLGAELGLSPSERSRLGAGSGPGAGQPSKLMQFIQRINEERNESWRRVRE